LTRYSSIAKYSLHFLLSFYERTALFTAQSEGWSYDKKKADGKKKSNDGSPALPPTSDCTSAVIDTTEDCPARATSIEAFLIRLDLYNPSMTPVKLDAFGRFCNSIQPPGPARVTQTPGTWPYWGDDTIDRHFQELVDTIPERFDVDRAKCVKPSGTLAASLLINWNYPPLNGTEVTLALSGTPMAKIPGFISSFIILRLE